MATAHINAKKEDIKEVVLMPGDPLRAKYIAEKFLGNFRTVNDVRGMMGYTGVYKNKEITVFASGMGCPSMGIYAYELYKFYDVKTIIRIGTSGANNKDIDLLSIVIADRSYSLSSFPKLFFNDDNKLFDADTKLNDMLEETAKLKGLKYHRGTIITSDVFDVYIDDKERYFDNYKEAGETLASEMEAAALFAISKHLNKSATCLATIVDSPFRDKEVTSLERERSLDDMILLALDTAINNL